MEVEGQQRHAEPGQGVRQPQGAGDLHRARLRRRPARGALYEPVEQPHRAAQLSLQPIRLATELSVPFSPPPSLAHTCADEPFLKGAYFDSSLEMLARWPRLARFRAFSFVQDQPPVYDPPDSSSAIAGHQGIAQPIVLFRFFCVSVLAASPLASSIENLRLRIPNRSLLVPLTTHQTSSTSTPATHTHATSTLAPRLFPSLRYLDISTSHLGTESAVFALVRRHRRLEHLVIDRTSLLSSDAERSLEVVRALGRLIACAGVGIAAEASRSWRSLSEQLLRTTPSEPTASTSTSTGAAPKKKMRGRSAYGSEPRWKKLAAKERQKAEAEAAAAQSNGLGARPRRPRKMPSKVVVVPSPVRLRSLCAGANDFDRLERRESDGVSRRSAMDSALRQAWNEAWSEGLDRLDEVTEEKIAEWERNARLWDAAHEASSSESDASEGDTGASSRAGDGLGRPLLVTCSPDAYDPMLPLADGADMLEAWMRSFDLAPTTPALARAAVTQASVDGPAVLCLVPDCPEKGQVMWSEAMAAQSVAAGSARVDEDMSWQKGSGRHQVGCGHLLGRRIWNADAW